MTTNDQGRRRHASHAAPAHGAQKAPSARRASAPRRLASESTSIETIRTGQGARVTTRKNAAEAAGRARKSAEQRYLSRHPEARASQVGPKRSAGRTVLLVIAAILVLALVFALGTCVNAMLFPPQEEQGTTDQTLHLTESELAMLEEQEAHDKGQEVVAPDGSVSRAGVTYSLQQQEDGSWAMIATENGSSSTLFVLEGTPVTLARSADLLLVVENRDGGWDVVCYMIDGHSDATYLVGSDGQQWGGEGDAASAELSGSSIRVTDASGATSETPFE
ncbi:MAG TPA: DUF1616 domain-containing protein [Candidatus Olsenella pullistercoris]|uniref:DUF1616 domain-containing protein n=1 Tax=Candidatus Olsenella pullistercoris TaxID=2838712 RepID=A0A9D2EZ18_9ACTN|nr:DUF1616 domain-containing protein [Candidatus Olsenella pullistercoris]